MKMLTNDLKCQLEFKLRDHSIKATHQKPMLGIYELSDRIWYQVGIHQQIQLGNQLLARPLI